MTSAREMARVAEAEEGAEVEAAWWLALVEARAQLLRASKSEVREHLWCGPRQ